MSPEEIAVEIAVIVCGNFVFEQKPTARHDLVKKFEDPNLVNRLGQDNFIKAQNNGTDYLPTVTTFALLPPQSTLAIRGRQAFASLLPVLRGLFKTGVVNQRRQLGEIQEALAEAKKVSSKEDAQLGLFLWSGFGVFSHYQPWETNFPEEVSIAESILHFKDDDGPKAWDRRREWAIDSLKAGQVPTLEGGIPWKSDIEDPSIGDIWHSEDALWALLHPSLPEEARRAFNAGLYATSTEMALKGVQQFIRDRTGLTSDGFQLMNEAFAPKIGSLRFDRDGSQSGLNMQEGYHRMFQGAMQAIRNPKAHGLVTITKTRCVHFLVFASMLAETVTMADYHPPS